MFAAEVSGWTSLSRPGTSGPGSGQAASTHSKQGSLRAVCKGRPWGLFHAGRESWLARSIQYRGRAGLLKGLGVKTTPLFCLSEGPLCGREFLSPGDLKALLTKWVTLPSIFIRPGSLLPCPMTLLEFPPKYKGNQRAGMVWNTGWNFSLGEP